MTKFSHQQWYTHVTELKVMLATCPNDLELAIKYWEAISGKFKYDVRDGKRLIETFRACSLESDEGLATLLNEFRKLAEETGELPYPSLIDPPLENLLRFVKSQPNHLLSEEAAWILSFLYTDS
ncbi:MAG: hypothetical protein HON04_15825 [Planctomicrobium sp.]|jgi:hypothetical protein|nr:hypothetical protein [Planctomicrobium sp.]